MAKKSVLLRIASKRFFRRIRSRLKKRLRNNGSISSAVKKRYHLSNLAQYRHIPLYPEFEYDINVPEILCLIENHDETLRFFDELDNVLKNNRPLKLNIYHTKTNKIGLSASFLFDYKLKKYRQKWRKRNCFISLHGKISESKEVNNFLLSVGLLKELNINPYRFPPEQFDLDYLEKYYIFSYSGTMLRNWEKSKASTGIAQYFNTCFNYHNLELTDDGLSLLVDAFGEIIGNAEEHSGGSNDRWYARGYYEKSSAFCHFTIINHGLTIYQTLAGDSSTASTVLRRIEDIVKGNRTLVDKLRSSFSPEPLWNVMALQDGISSKRTESGTGSTRGQGLMDVLKFIESIKSSEDSAQVVVISGRSKILIDYEYPILKSLVEGEFRRKIVFNKSGNLHEPQDESKVIHLTHNFPGTIISGRFKINQKYLIDVMENSKDGKVA